MPRGKQNSEMKVHKNQKSFHYIMICYANNIQGHTFLFIDVTWCKHLKGEANISSTKPKLLKHPGLILVTPGYDQTMIIMTLNCMTSDC